MLDVVQIMELIPQRYPFLMLDKITDLEPGIKGTAYKNCTYNEEYFQGHFVHKPVMPGILLIEGLTQLATAVINSQDGYKGNYVFYSQISKARFKSTVAPGDVVRFEVGLAAQNEGNYIFDGTAYVEDSIILTVQLMLYIAA